MIEKLKYTHRVVLRELTNDDLGEVSQVHVDSFPNSSLTKLGPRIIYRYYLWQLMGPHEKVRAVGAFIDQRCIGFSFSGVFNNSVAGFLDRNKVFLAKEVLFHPCLLLNPIFRSRLFSSVGLLRRFAAKKQRSGNSALERAKPRSYGILSIAVSPDFQDLRIGRMLMNDAESEARKCGYAQMHLTVNPDNEIAVKFYTKLNWHKSPSESLWNGSMTKSLG